jgi:hypothetical protein
MSLKYHISAIVAQLTGTPTFVFGRKDELNSLAEYVDFQQGAHSAVFMYAIQDERGERSKSGGRKVVFGIYLQFLKQTLFTEWSSENDVIVQEMRELKNEFLNRLTEYEVNGNRVFNISFGDRDKSQNLYQKFDVNTTGVDLTIELRELYKDAFCIPNES